MTTLLPNDQYVEDLPGFDDADEAGFDGTLRGLDGRDIGEIVTWKEIAAAWRERAIKAENALDEYREV